MSQDEGIHEEERFEISESDVDEGTDKMESPGKCSRCRRPCSEHKGPTGARCKLEPLDEEQQEEYYKELNAKKKKNKTPRRDHRSTSTSSAPDMTGNAPGGSTAPTKVTPGAGGQIPAESRLLQQLLTAIQNPSSVMPTCQIQVTVKEEREKEEVPHHNTIQHLA